MDTPEVKEIQIRIGILEAYSDLYPEQNRYVIEKKKLEQQLLQMQNAQNVTRINVLKKQLAELLSLNG